MHIQELNMEVTRRIKGIPQNLGNTLICFLAGMRELIPLSYLYGIYEATAKRRSAKLSIVL